MKRTSSIEKARMVQNSYTGVLRLDSRSFSPESEDLEET